MYFFYLLSILYALCVTIFADSAQSLTVYTIKGQLVMKNAAIEEAAMKLRPGIYIINGKKIAIK